MDQEKLTRIENYPTDLQGDPGGAGHGRTWVELSLIWKSHSSCLDALPSLPVSHHPMRIWADSATAKIQVNPTRDLLEHPVLILGFVVSKNEGLFH